MYTDHETCQLFVKAQYNMYVECESARIYITSSESARIYITSSESMHLHHN